MDTFSPVKISKFDKTYFREFFQAKQLKVRCKLHVTGNSYYVIYLKIKTQQSLHDSKAMLIAIWSWKGFSLMHKWWSARNAWRKVTLSAVSDIDYCWSQRATLLDPYTLFQDEELSFPDVINWTHNAINISLEVHIDQVTTRMSWQNLTGVTAVSSAQTETSALTFCKHGILEAETLIAAPLGPLSWGNLQYHAAIDMFMITPIIPDFEAFKQRR